MRGRLRIPLILAVHLIFLSLLIIPVNADETHKGSPSVWVGWYYAGVTYPSDAHYVSYGEYRLETDYCKYVSISAKLECEQADRAKWIGI